jgi:hypothetical protein
MGWLFAVALGMQEKSSRAVLAALPPIALGHVASIASVVTVAAVAQLTLAAPVLKYGAAALLVGFGLYRALRARHLRWVGMRVGFFGLAAWAFLMATGHGAGLMLFPFLTHASALDANQMKMEGMGGAPALPLGVWSLAVAVHTFGYLLTMTAIAFVVYNKVGVKFLRTAWFNFDLVWAFALILSGGLMLFL